MVQRRRAWQRIADEGLLEWSESEAENQSRTAESSAKARAAAPG
jgi:hypothetical protein